MMASVHEYLAERHRAQDMWKFSTQERFQTILVQKRFDRALAKSDYHVFAKEMNYAEFHDWMTQPHHSQEAIALRLICVPRQVRERTVDLGKHTLEGIHRTLGHDLARHMADAIVCGTGRVQNKQPLDPGVVQYLSFHPSMTATWSPSDGGGASMICVADAVKLQTLRGLLTLPFVQDLMDQPQLPLLLCIILLGSEVDSALEAVKAQVRQVEVRTGHHSWKSRSEVAALGDLIGLAAKMSGCSTRVGSCRRKQNLLVDAFGSIRAGLEVNEAEDTWAPNRTLQSTVDALSTQLCAQRADTEFVQLRVKTQLEALFHLVAQNDALSAQEMAQDCRLLAVASKFDSSSMQCIAIVTMFFLPGTFVSSLLSIPLFDWDADSQVTVYRRSHWQPVLGVFFAITLPLMAVTFGVWTFWTLAHRNRARGVSVVDNAQLQFHIPGDEVRALTSKRSSVKNTPQYSKTW